MTLVLASRSRRQEPARRKMCGVRQPCFREGPAPLSNGLSLVLVRPSTINSQGVRSASVRPLRLRLRGDRGRPRSRRRLSSGDGPRRKTGAFQCRIISPSLRTSLRSRPHADGTGQLFQVETRFDVMVCSTPGACATPVPDRMDKTEQMRKGAARRGLSCAALLEKEQRLEGRRQGKRPPCDQISTRTPTSSSSPARVAWFDPLSPAKGDVFSPPRAPWR